MARRKEEGLVSIISRLPWQLGIALGVVGFVGVRYGVAAGLATSGNPFLAPIEPPRESRRLFGLSHAA